MENFEELVPPADVIPPHHRDFFTRSGRELLAYYIELCDLKPDEAILDVGSGGGRLAVPLTQYLTADGRYVGFDVIPERVRWCNNAIASRYTNFHFQVADVFNKTYNPKGNTRARDFTFPYSDDQFDFVVLISVFTHMLDEDVEAYLSEIARVLRKGGRCLATLFLLNDEALDLIQGDAARRDPARNAIDAAFSHDFGNYRVTNPELPEAVVAFDEDFVLGLFKRFGFKIRGPIHYGRWPGRNSNVPGGQDIILADR
jgi:SAM-dependent methyltransferase